MEELIRLWRFSRECVKLEWRGTQSPITLWFKGFARRVKLREGLVCLTSSRLLGVKPSDRTYAALRKMRNLKMSDSVAASINEILEIA
ncbi:hypothetical protein F2Q70_00007624 [Brassica cretica]|uniref:Uncharacterized protein n=1 Tax=Brassica cretica TaxID=69181 RepID=A0A8S9M3Q0_BRACR|nr:hypothetical protein F2Q70_00007624 [Brassica cretica]